MAGARAAEASVTMDDELRSKAHRLVRMVFQDVYANYHARPSVWAATPPLDVVVYGWNIKLGESNAGTLQVICAGIETFGRALLGYTVERDVSAKSFAAFVEAYFGPAYKGMGQVIYASFRCGLLHSHYLGFGSADGFFPTRNGRSLHDKHLEYADLSGGRASSTKDSQYFRLILNIDLFVEDFRQAVARFMDDVQNGRTKQISSGTIDLVANLKISLKEFPLEDSELLEQPRRSISSISFGDATVTATSTSYPLPQSPEPDAKEDA